ncbi:hypothetical protein LXT21_08965 [Myxococcus sp. K38C18041901]|uniref:hypothetical protein n=1 Tax=Myxococcus guangdongensis TaxID=2906760 RepID=UPI0020A6E599|nr:hypothetical protein [Myxococcus guangdongensis]MCP3058901.1 hypothetical protein [Myxococcus guangdongensis]
MAGVVGAQPGGEQNTASDTRGNPVTGTAPGNTAANTGNAATGARNPGTPANTGTAQGSAATGARTTGNAQGNTATGVNTGTAATGARNTGNAQGTAATGASAGASATGARNPSNTQGNATSTGAQNTGTGGAGRIMIGTEAVQASEDEDWFKGAARAAQAALPENTSNHSLENVVIASSAVSGRVKRVGRDTITVRDREGNDYVLTLDERSQGMRQGRRVSLRQLQEGTPVRAGFVLMGGRSIARDVRIRR